MEKPKKDKIKRTVMYRPLGEGSLNFVNFFCSSKITPPSVDKSVIREIKFDVYGKRQAAKIKLLPSVFSSLYSRIKIFVFAVNSKRHFSIFV